MNKNKILYIGAFDLPNNNASAIRAVNNARIFIDLGYEVTIIGFSNKKNDKYYYDKIECININRTRKLGDMFKFSCSINEYIREISDSSIIIAYNFPSMALKKIQNYCRKNNKKIICDSTEWYTPKDKNLLLRFLKKIDISCRMRFLQKKCDGLILISTYLNDYYKKVDNKIILPPLNNNKSLKKEKKIEITKFIYCGSPGEKDRIDIIVNSFNKLMRENENIELEIIGITMNEFFKNKKNLNINMSDRIKFKGYVDHKEALKLVENADYSLIIRSSNLTNNAGFPTKYSESISVGTPVISTDISDLKFYIEKYKNGYIVDENNLTEEIEKILKLSKSLIFDCNIFNYKNFIIKVENFLKKLNL